MKATLTIRDLLAAAIFMAMSLFCAHAADTLSVQDAHKMALNGDVLLVDIRTPGEWRDTQIGSSAVPISMHNSGFLENLLSATGSDKSKPIALICATGGRSQWLQQQLTRRGYEKIYDVAEGMIGSPAGPGWLKAGLPTKPYVP